MLSDVPQGMTALAPVLAFNTAISFVTNTNWQNYGGESTLSYLVQMLGLTHQNFLSAATGIVLAVALIRGFARASARTVGSFWVDITRCTLYVLLPLGVVFTLFLVWQGIPQTLGPYVDVTTLEGGKQTLALGPVASQVAIKMLGTNGGGFFNANAAHPFENPTALSNFVQMISIFALGAALTNVFGRMVGDQRQGWAILAAMGVLFVAGVAVLEQLIHSKMDSLRVNPTLDISTERAVIQGQGVLRSRPKISNCYVNIDFEVDADFIADPKVLLDLLNIAGKIAGVGDWRRSRRRQAQARAELLEQFALEARVDAVVPRQLPVVVDRAMEGLRGVLQVVRRQRREEDDIGRAIPALASHALERAAQAARHLLLPPRQRAEPVERLGAELLDGRALLTRQRRERRLAEFRRAEVDEVVRVVIPRHALPDVGVGDANVQLVAEVLVERLELWRQQLDRAPPFGMPPGGDVYRTGHEANGYDDHQHDAQYGQDAYYDNHPREPHAG